MRSATMPDSRRPDRRHDDAKVFVISVAAALAGMHPQTLRGYDRLGLVCPQRTPGGGRRYSARDVARLREVQRLSQEDGINLAGIKRIIALESQVDALRGRIGELRQELADAQQTAAAVVAAVHASYRRDLVRVDKRPLVVWQPAPRNPDPRTKDQ
jgi:MerR family transcriptional regulator/heat shock protein HspR